MQVPLQSLVPPGQPQAPALHSLPLPHCVPQPPQLFGSLPWVLTQVPLQSVRVPGHAQLPPLHSLPSLVQSVPHVPQFVLLLFVSTQSCPHWVNPLPQPSLEHEL
jgi:hypothetical protein